MKCAVRRFPPNIFLFLLGKQLKVLRVERNLTQEYLAFGLCSVTHLSKLENGKLSREDPDLLVKFAIKLDVSFLEIIHSVFDELMIC